MASWLSGSPHMNFFLKNLIDCLLLLGEDEVLLRPQRRFLRACKELVCSKHGAAPQHAFWEQGCHQVLFKLHSAILYMSPVKPSFIYGST